MFRCGAIRLQKCHALWHRNACVKPLATNRLENYNDIHKRCYSSEVRIGCASGFWGDTPTAPGQLVRSGEIDYLILDYLSEVTMSLLVAAQKKDPTLGWCPDFVSSMSPLLSQVKDKKIRVVTNAGGLNPMGCMKALTEAAKQAGTSLKVAVVTGDDLLGTKSSVTREQCPSPETIVSINAYTGAREVSKALDMGADIVITGRCSDSALALGPLVHSHKWGWENFTALANGSLAGHLIECGAQATGGIFTDWEKVQGWANCGFPIANVSSNGDLLIRKPKGTGGLVSRGTVAEQMLYEIRDPSAYLLPDVVADFSNVQIEEISDGVTVKGAKGLPPTGFYKAGGTYQDGWKATVVCPVVGEKAREKGRKTADAILTRSRAIFKHMKLEDFTQTHLQMLGTEEQYGENSRGTHSRDAVMWLAVRHSNPKALQIFAKEIASAGTGMAPGLTAVVGGRPRPTPVLRFFSYLTPKESVPLRIETSEGEVVDCPTPSAPSGGWGSYTEKSQTVEKDDDTPFTGDTISLADLAFLRSGDKGDTCNIGVVARDPKNFEHIKQALTPSRVAKYFQTQITSPDLISRFELPGASALNFVLDHSLGGGGISSLRPDPQGKGFASMLASMRIPKP